MNIRLCETLRPLRQRAGLTQAQLAERLGVSDRAVSRWENGTALPDVTLLPPLAMHLHVSVDALLGVDSQRRQSAIDTALSACSAAMQQGDAPAAIAPLREALALCRAADGRPARLSTQYGCKQVMALALHRLDRSEEAAQLVSDELPSFWASRELLYTRVAPPDKAQSQRQFNLLWLADHLYFTLREMAKADPTNAIPLLEKAVRVYREITGPHAGMYEERICQAQVMLAQLHAQAGDMAAALSALMAAREAISALAAHDGRYAAPYLPDAHDAPAAPRTLSTLKEHLRTAMAGTTFNPLREDAAFAALAREVDEASCP